VKLNIYIMKNWTKIIKPKKPKIWTFFKPKNLGLFRSHFPALYEPDIVTFRGGDLSYILNLGSPDGQSSFRSLVDSPSPHVVWAEPTHPLPNILRAIYENDIKKNYRTVNTKTTIGLITIHVSESVYQT